MPQIPLITFRRSPAGLKKVIFFEISFNEFYFKKPGRVIFNIITTRLLSDHNWPLARLWVNARRECLKLLRHRFDVLVYSFLRSSFSSFAKNVHRT